MHAARHYGKRNVQMSRQHAAHQEQVRPGLRAQDPNELPRIAVSETVCRINVSRESPHGREPQATQLRNPTD